MKNNLISLFLALTLFVGGCQNGNQGSNAHPPKKVVVTTLMSHPALDEVQAGMKEEMTKLGYKDGSNITYQYQNANGDVQATATIAKSIAADHPDAVVAITTPMAQAVVNTKYRPVVFAAVTDPIGAKLVSSLDAPTAGVTGTSDAWPYEAQLSLIKELTPNVKVIGVLHNPGEAASQYGMTRIRNLAPKLGFTLVEAAVNTTSEVNAAAQNLAPRCDALFLSSDNTVIGGAAGAIKVAERAKKPLYAGDSGTVEKGALASVSVGYHALGVETARLLDKVLKGDTNQVVSVCQDNEVYLNAGAAKRMGVSIPASVKSKAKKVYGSD